jgi:xanthine/uracil permease
MIGVVLAGRDGGLGAAYGSMALAGMIFVLLSLPIGRRAPISYIVPAMTSPLVYGTLLVIIGAQLAAYGLPQWFRGENPAASFAGALLTALVVLACMLFGGQGVVRRNAVILGMTAGILFFAATGRIDLAPIADAAWFAAPRPLAYGLSVSLPLTFLMLLGFIQATTESVGMYVLLGRWLGQEVDDRRICRGLLGEYIGCVVGALFGGFGTTTYAQNVGIVRITGIASRFATLAAGMLAIGLSFLPAFCLFMASLPSPVLAGASTILFGIIAISGVQMMREIEWDELNLAVAGTGFIVAMGTASLPKTITASLPRIVEGIVTQPMVVGVAMLVGLNLIVNGWVRPALDRRALRHAVRLSHSA